MFKKLSLLAASFSILAACQSSVKNSERTPAGNGEVGSVAIERILYPVSEDYELVSDEKFSDVKYAILEGLKALNEKTSICYVGDGKPQAGWGVITKMAAADMMQIFINKNRSQPLYILQDSRRSDWPQRIKVYTDPDFKTIQATERGFVKTKRERTIESDLINPKFSEKKHQSMDLLEVCKLKSLKE